MKAVPFARFRFLVEIGVQWGKRMGRVRWKLFVYLVAIKVWWPRWIEKAP